MKKLKNSLIIVISILMMLTGCSNAVETDYDSILLENASKVNAELGFDINSNPFADGSRYFTVSKSSKNEFVIDINGTEIIVQIPSKTSSSEYVPSNVSDVSSQNQKIVAKSKQLVYQYIDVSKILKDKENIKNYIDSLATKEGIFTDDDDVGAYFSHTDNCIYINKDNLEHICEWMIVHELIHAISYYTHGCSIENEEYAFNLFNEVLTDMITSTINPQIDKNIQSGYYLYYDLLYPYINLFGKDAIDAYFYGYDNIYKQIEKEEFEFFVILIENFGEESSDVYYNNLMYKWNAKKVLKKWQRNSGGDNHLLSFFIFHQIEKNFYNLYTKKRKA